MTFQEMTMDRSSFLREAASSNNVVQWSQLRSVFLWYRFALFTIKMLHYTGPLTTALDGAGNLRERREGYSRIYGEQSDDQ